MKSRLAGIVGIASATLFIAAAAVSVLTFEDGAYSPLGCFVTELGAYTHSYFTISSALFFNAGMIASGLLLAAFMVIYGIRKNSAAYTAASFFGMLCALFIAAQGIFTLNFDPYHFILKAAFSVCMFAACAIYAAAEMRSGSGGLGLARCVTAAFAGCAAAAFAVFALTGGYTNVFVEDLSAARPAFLPFAVVDWASYLLLFVLTAMMSLQMITAERNIDTGTDGGHRRKPKNRGIEI